MNPKLIIICGPTAVGKTTIGFELAQKFNGEVISADSQQVYRGMDIGTAKYAGTRSAGRGTCTYGTCPPIPVFRGHAPGTIRCREHVPVYLIDVVNPDEHFDVSTFQTLADKAIDEIIRNKKLPFVVGGTGMYIRILCHGLCEAPPQDADYRAELSKQINERGLEFLYNQLKEKDPETAAELHPNDKSRIIRALEVLELTGEGIKKFQAGHKFKEKRYDYLKIGLDIDRKILYDRINQRTDEMIKAGWLDETRSLLEKYSPGCQAFKAVGYRELVLHIQGLSSLDYAIEEIKKQTRHFAKRQITWFKADKEIKWFEPAQIKEIENEIEKFLI